MSRCKVLSWVNTRLKNMSSEIDIFNVHNYQPDHMDTIFLHTICTIKCALSYFSYCFVLTPYVIKYKQKASKTHCLCMFTFTVESSLSIYGLFFPRDPPNISNISKNVYFRCYSKYVSITAIEIFDVKQNIC